MIVIHPSVWKGNSRKYGCVVSKINTTPEREAGTPALRIATIFHFATIPHGPGNP